MTRTHERLQVTTTLGALLQAIDEVTETQEEAFAVLELMLEEDRISVLGSEIAVAA